MGRGGWSSDISSESTLKIHTQKFMHTGTPKQSVAKVFKEL